MIGPNRPNKLMWALGKLLIDPQKVFVLWAVKVRFCVSLDNFRDHYGPDFPISKLVDELGRDGFLRQRDGEIVLTEIGEQAVACLKDNELSPHADSRREHQGEITSTRRNNNFQHLMAYLSVTDPDFIQKCPRKELYIQEIIGIAVLLTSILAGWSGGYALYTVFENHIYAIGFGVFWGLMIMNLDRLLVGTSFISTGVGLAEAQFLRRYIAPIVLRLPIAILLGIIISIPLVLKIFEPEINACLNEIEANRGQQIEVESLAKKNELRKQLWSQLDDYDKRIAALDEEMQKLWEELRVREENPVIRYIRQKNATGNYTQVRVTKESEIMPHIRRNIKAKENERKAVVEERKLKEQTLEQTLKEAGSTIDSADKAKKENSTPRSLLSRYKALTQIWVCPT